MDEKIIEQRILAIDFGLKRVGLALSDPLKIFSYPFMTIPYDNEFWRQITSIVKENSVSKIILGYPINSFGNKTPLSDEVMKLKQELEKRLKLDVLLWDERFTSEIAKQMVMDSVTKKSKRRDKGLLDRNSASVILQEYLNSSANRKQT
jgi:putative holliday junction resolvase